MPVVVYIWCASDTGRVTEVPCLVKTLLAFCDLSWHSGFWHLGPDLVSTCGLARRCHHRHHMNEFPPFLSSLVKASLLRKREDSFSSLWDTASLNSWTSIFTVQAEPDNSLNLCSTLKPSHGWKLQEHCRMEAGLEEAFQIIKRYDDVRRSEGRNNLDGEY